MRHRELRSEGKGRDDEERGPDDRAPPPSRKALSELVALRYLTLDEALLIMARRDRGWTL